MKKVIALIVTMTFLGSSFSLPAFAAVKTGTKCSTKGLTKESLGKKYTCIKSGKKFIWSKGVVIVKPAAEDTDKPTPNAESTKSAQVVSEGQSCAKMGLQGSDATGLLECRKFIDNKLAYVRINNDFSPIENPKSPDPVTLCQLPDMRTNKSYWRPAIAYPPIPQRNFKSSGVFKVAVVGIDFSDAPGKGAPSLLWEDDIVKMTEWLKWYTNGNVRYDFVVDSEWRRAPRESGKYNASNNTIKGDDIAEAGGLLPGEIASDFIGAIEDSVNLSNVSAIFIYHPSNISKIVGQWTTQEANVQTKSYGLITPMMVATGADTYLSKRVRWGYFLHELLHAHGIFGHSPKFLPSFRRLTRIGALSTADGYSNALLPWDALVAGWQKPEDYYCIDKSKVTSVDLKLVPLEREQQGNRAAMIKLNDHQVLVIESHRKDKWGVWEGIGSGGVMVSLVDTTLNTDWDGNSTPDNPASTATYLRVPGANHGVHQPIGTKLINDGVVYYGVGLIDGVGISGDGDAWDLNHVMYIGETIVHDGIKITLTKGGDNDTVRIEKAS
jgi:hypothetical protein